MAREGIPFSDYLDYVRAHPGSTAKDLARHLNQSDKAATSRLGSLFKRCKDGQAEVVRAWRRTAPKVFEFFYYPADQAPEDALWPPGFGPKERPAKGAEASTAERLLAYIGAHPGLTTGEACKALKIAPGSGSAALAALYLKRKGEPVIDRVPEGITFRWYLPADLPEAVKAEREREAAKAAPAPPAEPVPEAAEATEIPPEPEAVEAPALIAAALDHLIEAIGRAVALEVDRRVPAVVARHLDKALRAQAARLTGEAPPPAPAPAPPKPRRPKVVVVGMKQHIHFLLGEEFKDRFHMDFVGQTEGAKVLKDKLPHAEHVFIATKFVSHALQEAVKKSGRPFTYVDGGQTGMQQNLAAYAKLVGEAA